MNFQIVLPKNYLPVSHTSVYKKATQKNSEYYHAINGYRLVDNLGHYWSTGKIICPVTEIKKVTKNNTGMYTKEISSQIFKIPKEPTRTTTTKY